MFYALILMKCMENKESKPFKFFFWSEKHEHGLLVEEIKKMRSKGLKSVLQQPHILNVCVCVCLRSCINKKERSI